MLLKIFSIRDDKAGYFNTPFFQRTTGEAERSLQQLVSDKNTLPGKYPEDYSLYEIGSYDDQTGLITAEDSPRHIVKAVQFAIAGEAPRALKTDADVPVMDYRARN